MYFLSVCLMAVLGVQYASCSWYGGWAGHGGHYAGPLAAPVVTPSGFLADTPEVAAAKAAHLALVAGAAAGAPAAGWAGAGVWNAYGHGGVWTGPLATLIVTPSGYLADTPEVAALKAKHLSALHAGGAWYGGGWNDGSWNDGSWDDGSWNDGAWAGGDDGSYHPGKYGGHY